MIEQGIYFALGCIVTALAALGFTPLLWRRALRLTRRRLELQVPLSMQEILAERDQLRAEFAVERLRHEQAIEHVRGDKGRDMAELGRRTAQAVTFADQVNALRRLEQAQDKEIRALSRELAELGAEAGTVRVALDDGHAFIDRLKRRLEATENACDDHLAEAAAHRATIATLETRVADLEARRGEEGVGGWIKAAVAQVTGQTTGHAAAGEDEETQALRRQVDALRRDVEAAREREKAATLRQGLQAHSDRAAERADALERTDAMEALRAENVALRGALDAARREGGRPPADDAGLRDSIHALGLAVAAMTRDAEARTAGSHGAEGVPEAPAPLAQAKVPRPLGAN